MVPGGLRMGSPALTSRGFVESDFEQVAEFVNRCGQGSGVVGRAATKAWLARQGTDSVDDNSWWRE